jgi:hypothetical protein
MTEETLEAAIRIKNRIDDLEVERNKLLRMVQAIKSAPEYIVYMHHHRYSKDSLDLDCRWNKDLAKFLEDKIHSLYLGIERLKVDLEKL